MAAPRLVVPVVADSGVLQCLGLHSECVAQQRKARLQDGVRIPTYRVPLLPSAITPWDHAIPEEPDPKSAVPKRNWGWHRRLAPRLPGNSRITSGNFVSSDKVSYATYFKTIGNSVRS